jgi:hypothetical protein
VQNAHKHWNPNNSLATSYWDSSSSRINLGVVHLEEQASTKFGAATFHVFLLCTFHAEKWANEKNSGMGP